MILSSPLILIFTERINFRQNPVQYPISFPPNKVIFLGRNKAGKKIIEITIIPKKKNIENKEFLIIFVKS
tara:strand:+ start:521 stop:730 length:210 start_codon:yes stop_codon:yes gene_type:complete